MHCPAVNGLPWTWFLANLNTQPWRLARHMYGPKRRPFESRRSVPLVRLPVSTTHNPSLPCLTRQPRLPIGYPLALHTAQRSQAPQSNHPALRACTARGIGVLHPAKSGGVQITEVRHTFRQSSQIWAFVRQLMDIAVELGKYSATQALVSQSLLALGIRYHTRGLGYRETFMQSGTLEQ